MRESNLYEYDLLAVSRDLIPRFELCQFDETFNVFCLYSIQLNKTFCVDNFARSLPASILVAKSRKRKVRGRSPRMKNVGNLQNLAFYVWFC